MREDLNDAFREYCATFCRPRNSPSSIPAQIVKYLFDHFDRPVTVAGICDEVEDTLLLPGEARKHLEKIHSNFKRFESLRRKFVCSSDASGRWRLAIDVSDDDLPALILAAREEYIRTYEAERHATQYAAELFSLLSQDTTSGKRDAERHLTAAELHQRLRLPDPPSAEILAEIGRQLERFTFVVFGRDRWWQMRFRGPTAAFRKRASHADRLYLEYTYVPVEPAVDPVTLLPEPRISQPRPVTFSDLVARCFCCGYLQETYDPDQRSCTDPNCYSNRPGFPPEPAWVTLLPEPATGRTPPPITDIEELFTAVSPDVRPDLRTDIRTDVAQYQRLLPYTRDHLRELGMHLGKPLTYRAPRLEVWTGFSRVYILDMSGYRWGNSSKDLPAWAIINLAREYGVTQLVGHTTGNAGLSLAKIAYDVSRRTTAPLQAHLLLDGRVSDAIREGLRIWGAKLHSLPSQYESATLGPSMVWRIINAAAGAVSDEAPPGMWNVSDGWDGVSISMYRIVLRELLQKLSVDYVVAPLGTGALVLGAWLGVRDSGGMARIICASPPAHSVNAIFGSSHLISVEQAPVASKLAVPYTPLARCLAFLACHDTSSVDLITVSRRMQLQALDHIRSDPAAEPSATIAAAALRGADGKAGLLEYANQHSRDVANVRALIINTGVGAFDATEFLALWTKGERS